MATHAPTPPIAFAVSQIALDTTRHVREPAFYRAVALALGIHLSLLALTLHVSTPRRMGEADGAAEGVTVEIVDEKALTAARDTPASPPVPSVTATPPAPTAPEQAAQPPAPPQPQEAPPPTAPPPPPPSAAPSSEPTDAPALRETLPALVAATPSERPAAKDATKPPAKKTAKAQPAPDFSDPELLSTRSLQNEPPTAATTPNRKGAKPANQVSLAMPKMSADTPIDVQGRATAVSRPEGITRSGLNDEFGRHVIKALRQTMPPHAGVNSEVAVRFTLSESGNLLEVVLVRAGSDPIMNQNVMFAIKQTNFPIPIANSLPQDRVFRVTYVYK